MDCRPLLLSAAQCSSLNPCPFENPIQVDLLHPRSLHYSKSQCIVGPLNPAKSLILYCGHIIVNQRLSGLEPGARKNILHIATLDCFSFFFFHLHSGPLEENFLDPPLFLHPHSDPVMGPIRPKSIHTQPADCTCHQFKLTKPFKMGEARWKVTSLNGPIRVFFIFRQ